MTNTAIHSQNTPFSSDDVLLATHSAMFEDNLTGIRRLLDQGMSPDYLDQNWKGFTLLMRASSTRLSLAQLLLRYKATVDLSDDFGWTSLMIAVCIDGHLCSDSEYVKIVTVLLEHGADPKRRNGDGLSSLDLLDCQVNNSEAVKTVRGLLTYALSQRR